MPADTTVKYLHSAMTGAPSLSGTAGALIALLDACIVNGFGSGTVDSVVIAGGIATVTRAAGHPFEVDSVVEIAGATVSGGSIDGQHKVLTAPNVNTYTFDATGLANQTATGTITHKVAALGWSKPFSGTNLAAYKPTNVAASGSYLRVDDSNSREGRVVGYETMSDIDTGTGPFPTNAQVGGGLYWSKSDAASSATRPWILVGDSRIFYLMIASYEPAPSQFNFTCVFGDINSVKSPDPYRCVLNGSASSVFGTSPGNSFDYHYCSASSSEQLFMSRAYSGLGGAISLIRSFPLLRSGTNPGFSGAGSEKPSFPNLADGGVYVSPHLLLEGSSSVFRGVSPGMYCLPQNVAHALPSKNRLSPVVGLQGRVLIFVTGGNSSSWAFDITGPWG